MLIVHRFFLESKRHFVLSHGCRFVWILRCLFQESLLLYEARLYCHCWRVRNTMADCVFNVHEHDAIVSLSPDESYSTRCVPEPEYDVTMTKLPTYIVILINSSRYCSLGRDSHAFIVCPIYCFKSRSTRDWKKVSIRLFSECTTHKICEIAGNCFESVWQLA